MYGINQGIFPTQESNPGLLHCRQTLYPLSYKRRFSKLKDTQAGNEKAGSKS